MDSAKSLVEKTSGYWRDAGIDDGDTLLLHSSMRRTLGRLRELDHTIGMREALEGLVHAVGRSGTLLLPLFNFEFAEGVPFDIRTTPSQMGGLSEAARVRSGTVRTGHPIYSFAVIGHHARLFTGLDNRSGYGPDSPFAILRQLEGSIASLDLEDQHSMTFYHHVEEMLDVPYRHFKTFSGLYTDGDGSSSVREYELFVRRLELGVRTDVNRAGEAMWRMGLYSGDRPLEGSGLRRVDAGAMFEFVRDIIVSGQAEGMLYSIDSET